MAITNSEFKLVFDKLLCLIGLFREDQFSLLILNDYLTWLAIITLNSHIDCDLSASVLTNVKFSYASGSGKEVSESDARLVV